MYLALVLLTKKKTPRIFVQPPSTFPPQSHPCVRQAITYFSTSTGFLSTEQHGEMILAFPAPVSSGTTTSRGNLTARRSDNMNMTTSDLTSQVTDENRSTTTQNIIFGTFSVVLACATLVVAVVQLWPVYRHIMRRRRKFSRDSRDAGLPLQIPGPAETGKHRNPPATPSRITHDF